MNLKNPITENDIWGEAGPVQALNQVVGLLKKKFPLLEIKLAPDGLSFHSVEPGGAPRKGIQSVQGTVLIDSVLAITVELVRAAGNVNVSPLTFLEHLAALGERCRLLPPEHDKSSDTTSIRVELRAQATPLSLTRENALLKELSNIDTLAESLQAELPAYQTDSDLAKAYEKVSEYLEPVLPWTGESPDAEIPLLDWARETIDFLLGSTSIAVCAACPAAENFSLAVLARAASEMKTSLGRLIPPMINTRALVEVTKKAPGITVVPAIRLKLGSNPYELGYEIQSLLAAFSASGTPVLFTGTMEQLQEVFHGGQGGTNDPLSPILRRVPEVSIEELARFAVRSAGQAMGGIPAKAEMGLIHEILDSLTGKGEAEQKRLLPVVAGRAVNLWKKGKSSAAANNPAFATRVGGLSETLAGLSAKPRVERSPRVQEHYTRVFTDPDLLPYLKEKILSQDEALEQLISRLRMEVLARPLHQPFRYCAQGTPATGKSESAVLLARRLNIPYVNIDAAGMPDYYTASSQLLGAGRGIVNSYKSGRMEQAAKHHAGALVEVSDLDHAVPTVRCALADLFLQLLETGEAQSATGAMFSCANLIFAFTMNLPEGEDERVRKRLGFGNRPSRSEVRKDVSSAIKKMLSGAFLSRIGTPILFEPLDEEAMAEIMERSIRGAMISAAQRMKIELGEVRLAKEVGRKLLSSLESNITSFGARAVMEQGRILATRALLEKHRDTSHFSGKDMLITTDSEGNLKLKFSAEKFKED